MRRDSVTPELWQQVIERDAIEMWMQTEGKLSDGARIPFWQWRAHQPLICVVRFLDPHTSGTCSGQQTVEHVKDQLMMGKRAPSDMRHLVACCWWHNAVRIPSKQMRYQLRTWLRRLHPEAHVAL